MKLEKYTGLSRLLACDIMELWVNFVGCVVKSGAHEHVPGQDS